MKKIQFITLVLCCLIASSCNKFRIKGDGNIVEHEIQMEDYQEFSLSVPATIFYEQKADEKPYLRIETDENIYALLKIESQEGELKIYSQEDSLKRFLSPTKCNIYTNSTSLSKVSIAGIGTCHLEGSISTDTLKISISGSGTLKADSLNCTQININSSGSSDLTLKGKTDELICRSSGACDMEMYELNAREVTCRISGKGTMKTSAEEKLDVKISGMGKVFYKGDPTIEKSISGMGKVAQTH